MIGSHRIRTAWRCTGSSSSVDSSTPSAVTTATSLSSRNTTSRVWERIAGMSEAMNISPRPSPTMTLDQVSEHLGVGLGPERVALAAQAVLDLEVVLEDSVVDDDEVAAAIGVGVRVLVRGPAVGGPARVADPERARHGALTQDPLERLDAPGGAADLELAVLEHRNPCRVVPAVLQALEPLDDDGHRVLVTDVADDAAHDYSSGRACFFTLPAAHPSFTTCCPRATASAPGGTSWVMVEPAPM